MQRPQTPAHSELVSAPASPGAASATRRAGRAVPRRGCCCPCGPGAVARARGPGRAGGTRAAAASPPPPALRHSRRSPARGRRRLARPRVLAHAALSRRPWLRRAGRCCARSVGRPGRAGGGRYRRRGATRSARRPAAASTGCAAAAARACADQGLTLECCAAAGASAGPRRRLEGRPPAGAARRPAGAARRPALRRPGPCCRAAGRKCSETRCRRRPLLGAGLLLIAPPHTIARAGAASSYNLAAPAAGMERAGAQSGRLQLHAALRAAHAPLLASSASRTPCGAFDGAVAASRLPAGTLRRKLQSTRQDVQCELCRPPVL